MPPPQVFCPEAGGAAFDVEGPYLDDRKAFSPTLEFMMFIETALLNIRGESISKFRLRWTGQRTYFCTWFSDAVAAIPRMVKALKVLDLASESTETVLPPEIFTCETLEVMKLGGPLTVKLPAELHLPKLAELELNWVLFLYNGTVHRLISSCPVLQSFTVQRKFTRSDNSGNFCTISSLSLKRLHICFTKVRDRFSDDRYSVIKIDAPALEYLYLSDSLLRKISVQGSTSLNEVELDLLRSCELSSSLLKTFDGVKFLKLSKKTMKAFLRARTRHLPACFQRLTKLVVEYDSSQSNFLLNLIDRCISLEVLEIYCCNIADSNSGAISSHRPFGFRSCRLSSLKQVTFRPLHDVDLSMIEVILSYGPVMDRVNLCFDHAVAPHAYERMDEILQKVLKMNKVYPSCEFYSSSDAGRLYQRIG